MGWLCPLTAVLLLCCGWAAACPEGCSCYHEQSLYVASCSSLPYSGGKVESLTLLPTRDSPLELSDGQFNSARHLKYLSLKNCSIYFIHKKAFYGAKNILEIDLSFNYIEELDPSVFQHLTSLSTLILRGNPLHVMPEVPFLISNSLQHLDIGQCKLRGIPRGIFYGLKRLKYLSLDGNFLKSLKYNSLPKGLKYLNLAQNLIVNVPTEVLSALTNLRRIGLSGNPINCSCSLMNLQDWLSGQGVIFEDNVTCSSPSEYHGVSWSKVDENRLCLAEAKREEHSHPTSYNRLFKNRLYRGNYFENENNYFENDNVQSDQPQSLLPDPQAEVLFQNDDTLAMGEMMRDEEDMTNLNEKEVVNSNKDTAVLTDQESATIGKTPEIEKDTEVKEMESQESKIENQNKEASETKNEETTQEVASIRENVVDNKDENLESLKEDAGKSVEIIDAVNTSNTTDVSENLEDTIKVDPSQPLNLNDSKPVVYSGEETNTEFDDLKNEGLFHVGSSQYMLNTNDSLEQSTAIPDPEDITEDDIDSTPETITDVVGLVQSSTLSSELNDTNVDDEVEETVPPPIIYPDLSSSAEVNETISGEDKIDETVPPPVSMPDLRSGNDHQNESEIVLPVNEDETLTTELDMNADNNSLLIPYTKSDNMEEKVKEVAGAEVVMFCIGVLLICLILYSVYKCRTSSNRQSRNIVKDMESNRGTEMQDMASLLPKPQEDDQKNNSKYPDKAPSSETMKLITEQNENEAPNFISIPDTKNKIEDKNSLNNNTNSSPPTSKTPLIKSGNPITINPAAPIQRTKVKVGIIPDSIPRTPIFLQKTYNNGTKNV